MLIKSCMGVSADGFVSTPEGVPAIAVAPGFEPGISHGYPEFIEGCDAVVMGWTTFLPARPSGGDVHLVGGPRTIRAFSGLGALDRLELVMLPMLPGEGLPLSPQGTPPVPLTLLRADRTFPDGSAELVYRPA